MLLLPTCRACCQGGDTMLRLPTSRACCQGGETMLLLPTCRACCQGAEVWGGVPMLAWHTRAESICIQGHHKLLSFA